MGKTFEALMQAERERQERLEENHLAPPPNDLLLKEFDIPFQIVEEYHRMEYKISNMYPKRTSKVILFVSPNEGEGNSTVLTQFGITLALGGNRVLLVDTNLRCPSIHRLFDLPGEKGLTDLILKKYDLKETIKNTSLQNLRVITSGNNHTEAIPILTFSVFDSAIEKMKSEADWILFDAPPIHVSNDAIALAPKVDGVIIVIKAEKTRWEVAQNVRQRIESGKGNILGVVLNERRFYIPEWLYQRLG